MNKHLSAYLDAARFTAAVFVLLSHVEDDWAPGVAPFCIHLGLEAVGVFFVLSGYLIAYTSRKRGRWQEYCVNRASRLYSVVVPCLLLTYALDLAGQALIPHGYTAFWPPLATPLHEAAQMIVSLGFVNQMWGWGMIPGCNGPYWSICYEVAYYAMFGVVLYLRGWQSILALTVLSLAEGYQIAIAAPLWLLGVAAYHAPWRLSRLHARLLLAATATAWGAMEYLRVHTGHGMTLPTTVAGRTWQLYATGVPFAASVIGIRYADLPLATVLRPARWLSGATFTLYLSHFAVGRFMAALLPHSMRQSARWALIVCAALIAAALLAEFTERRMEPWKRLFRRLARQPAIAKAGLGPTPVPPAM